MRSPLWVFFIAVFGSLEAAAKSVPTVIAYYLSTSCDTTPNRVDLEFDSNCTSGCLGNLPGDWQARNFFCSLGDYKKAVWDAFRGASYLLQESYINDCESRVGASAFLASGNCEQVIMNVSAWGYPVYSIAQLESDGSASVNYFTDSDCTTTLPKSEPLTPSISAQDTTIDKATLNSDNCDGDNYRWSYYSSSSPYTSASGSGSAVVSTTNTTEITGSTDANPISKDNSSAKVTPTTSTTAASGNNVGVIIGAVAGVLVVVLVALGFVWHRRRGKGSDTLETNNQSQSPNQYLAHATPGRRAVLGPGKKLVTFQNRVPKRVTPFYITLK
ncbi:hypothetical protein PF011_g29930 [Phytophthora fragariae]|uniref:Uncharacterized protein n=1 Tax=Phytophthora fragariae TaxID=53985 RepID=A0A6A3GVT1_9STRA|nr:hypothetical protein PF011_g29930 [Phytophthora fragariae]